MSPTKSSGGSSRKGVPVSPEHKEAIARGKRESTIIRRYLDTLQENQPVDGRKKTSPSVLEKRINKIRKEIETTESSTSRLSLIQKMFNLEDELEKASKADQQPELEAEFINVAKSYSERKHISARAWEAVGVKKQVLREAGIIR